MNLVYINDICIYIELVNSFHNISICIYQCKYIVQIHLFIAMLIKYRVDRLHYLTYLQHRWNGPMSLAIFSTPAELHRVQKALRSLHNRIEVVRVVLYIAKEKAYYYHISLGKVRQETTSKLYPINLLRDLAILNVVTTHYVNLDMDLWPSNTLREDFHKLSAEILENPKSALILPAFQFSPNIRRHYNHVTSVNAVYVL